MYFNLSFSNNRVKLTKFPLIHHHLPYLSYFENSSSNLSLSIHAPGNGQFIFFHWCNICVSFKPFLKLWSELGGWGESNGWWGVNANKNKKKCGIIILLQSNDAIRAAEMQAGLLACSAWSCWLRSVWDTSFTLWITVIFWDAVQMLKIAADVLTRFSSPPVKSECYT